jgi:hypothetical protein
MSKERIVYYHPASNEFYDHHDLHEFMGINDLMTVEVYLCEPATFTPVGLEYWEDDIDENHGFSREFRKKVDEFNQWLSTQKTNQFRPTNQKVIYGR